MINSEKKNSEKNIWPSWIILEKSASRYFLYRSLCKLQFTAATDLLQTLLTENDMYCPKYNEKLDWLVMSFAVCISKVGGGDSTFF